MTPINNTEPCPCNSGKNYQVCCQPLHRGEQKATRAEQLMRSRYCAFSLGNIDYLLATTQASQRPNLDRRSLQDWLARTSWQGLEILSTESGDEHSNSGSVEFKAWYQLKGDQNTHCHHEKSEFIREHNTWVFIDPSARVSAPGRNSPCPCGSGKKFKRCCGR
ncbi:YchJ family protein [Aestuariirhabdus sp. Z084]|uniref:YchJ family protein n=1 Tax=Aestuariirhabdus haliotis TaxID=2918751 RepID=UPI00201B45A3|nr:YchJ family protein [Aestuariirhabdus haliotis]MCL6417487.1 YchJ family protein [Aestuariirhabdus haliotis]MCL6421427.1 YchJ family protein [Aestuariirhabdus haliotis]